jgi:exodeoxyribonuclease V beta subunit
MLKKNDEAALQGKLAALAAGLGGALKLASLPEMAAPSLSSTDASAHALSARAFKGTIPPPWHISSFTTLAARLGDEEAPDHDALEMQPAPESAVPAPGHFIPPPPTFSRLADFPRGARAGSCLHALLERVDFQGQTPVASVAAAVLDEFAYPRDWQAVLERMVAEVIATPLNHEGMRLAQVPRSERLIELEFTFPLASSSGQAGYMKGFIDLVFRHAGRWYIVDYKSNWLGDCAEDYAQPQLAAAMRQHRYDLQLRIYAAALQRALALREPDLDWAECFGGVFYLFLRGMQTAYPAGAGVYFARPEDSEIAEFLERSAA